jgi:4-amino-4-deoxy-L-arabinose transferase-like glycosyltransferase
MAIALIAFTVTMLATTLVQYPEHDEFAYFGDALYGSGLHSGSGMAFNGENYSVTFVERPPLFWWLLTSLFSLGFSPYSALVISPLFTALNAVLVCLFAYELTRDLKSGIFAGVLAGISGFAISIGSHVLSDAMGSFLAALAMFSFYEYVFKNRRWFALISGASIGLGLVARDEDLVTLVLMIVLWILFMPKGGVRRKFLYLMVLGALFGIPLKLYGEIGTLQLISNLATPIVFGWWPVIVAVGAFLTFLAYRATNHSQIAELVAAFFAFFVTMLPFFFNNYTIGNVDYYIAGKGILARPVAHLMMIPQTGGVGANLATSARMMQWLQSMPALLSIPVIISAAMGIYFLARSNKKNFLFLFLWTLVTFGFVVGDTNLEDRFLLIAFAPIMIFAGIGLGYVSKRNYLFGIIFGAATCFLANIIPRSAITFSDLTVVASLTTHASNWLYVFLPTITLDSPSPVIPISLIAEGLLSIPFVLVVLLISSYVAVTKPSRNASVTHLLPTGLLGVPTSKLAQWTKNAIALQSAEPPEDEEIEITEGSEMGIEQQLTQELNTEHTEHVKNGAFKEEITPKHSDSNVSMQQSIVDSEKPRVGRFSGGEDDVETSWLFENEKTEH